MAPTSTHAALPVILPPTQTVPPTRAPSETQAPTATATPSKPAVLQDVEISTSKYGNDNIRNILPDFPIGEQTLGGVRFTIPASSNKISTQCQSHPDWPVAVQIMTGDVPAPRALFLLINAGYTSGFAGQVIGGIQVNFSDGSRLYFGLTLGQNIREWRIQSTGAVVTTSGSSGFDMAHAG